MHNLNKKILCSIHDPFHISGYLQNFMGNLGKAAVKISPEAAYGGPISQIKDGDILRFDALNGSLGNLACDFCERGIIYPDILDNEQGMGRELFLDLRRTAGPASQRANVII